MGLKKSCRITFKLKMASRVAVASRRKESVGRGAAAGNGDNFKVAVRVRPLLERELRGDAPVVSSVAS